MRRHEREQANGSGDFPSERAAHLKRNVYVKLVSNTIGVSANSLWIMFMPYYFMSLGLDEPSVGLVFTVQAAALAFMSLPGGRLADKVGRKPIIIAGMFVYSLGPLLLMFIEVTLAGRPGAAVPWAVAVYVAMFAGSGIARPANSMLLIESSPKKHRGLSYMVATLAVPSIPPAVLVIWGSTLYVTGRFREALWWGFVGLAVMWFLDAAFLRETMPAASTLEAQSHELDEKRFEKKEGVGVLLVVMIVAFAMDQIPSQGLQWYIPLFLGANSVVLFGIMTSISTLVIAFSAIGSGYLVDRLGPKRALAIQWSAIPVLATLFPFLQNMVLIIAVYAIWTGLDTIGTPIPPILIADHCPTEERAAAMGTFSLGTRLLSSTGPTLIALALLLGPAVPFILKALMDLLGLILISGFLSQKRANSFRE